MIQGGQVTRNSIKEYAIRENGMVSAIIIVVTALLGDTMKVSCPVLTKKWSITPYLKLFNKRR
jgi:hypothetical protein